MIHALLLTAALNMQPALDLHKPIKDAKAKMITKKVFRGLVTGLVITTAIFSYKYKDW